MHKAQSSNDIFSIEKQLRLNYRYVQIHIISFPNGACTVNPQKKKKKTREASSQPTLANHMTLTCMTADEGSAVIQVSVMSGSH